MDTVTIFDCVFLEFPEGYQPGDEYTRHVASFSLDVLVPAFVDFMTSPEAQVVELGAQESFGVVLDLTIGPLDASTYAAEYVVTDPDFVAGSTPEAQTTALATVFRDYVVATYPCGPIVYSSAPATA